jgi:protein CMS1
MQGGDDLEDDFVLDETVALSGDEGTETIAHLDDEDVFLDTIDDDEREDDDEGEEEDRQNGAVSNEPDTALIAKKRKRREKEKERKAKVRIGRLSRAETLHRS